MSLGRHPGTRLGTIGAGVVTAGAVLTIAGTFRGWVASGSRHRNSYDILALVERLGFAPDGPLGVALRAWPLVPLLVVATVVAAWWRHHLVATGCGLAAGVYAGGVGVAVSTGPREGVVRVLDGPRTTATGAAILVVGTALVAVAGVRAARATRPGLAEPASAAAADR